ncbi:MAG TPA: arylsulfotransferase family protein [Streptosporangiaceae bacterium]|nr:arylsulfotransferase family protein [Streptosporangiaceae bacterium]
MSSGNATRRQALAQIGGLGALAAGLGSLASPAAALAGATGLASPLTMPDVLGLRHYISRPDLTPPAVAVTSSRHAPAYPHYFFLTAPGSGPGPGGAMIVDRFGDLVWFSPGTDTTAKFSLNRTTFRGKPVLTWWEGLVTGGHGDGVAVIADASYQRLHTIRAQNGLTADLHECIITARNTALITCYRHASGVDLTSLGGPADGTVLAGVIQEIDIASGTLVFEWDSLDHIDLTETEAAFSGGTADQPFDYFHINSIQVAGNGDLLISARNTWALYRVERPSGTVRWRLGGKKSDFTMGPGASFFWQHHARLHSGGLLSLFDDGAAPAEEKQSRGLILKVDTAGKTVSVHQQYTHPKPALLAGAMGSMEVMNGGRVVVGWGTVPAFTEFAADGTVLADARIATGSPSYRAIRSEWTGKPAGHPAIAVRRHGTRVRVYASWNGATEIHRWRVLAGRTASSLSRAGAADKKSFETMVSTAHKGPHFRAVALGRHGHVLGRSPIVRLS